MGWASRQISVFRTVAFLTLAIAVLVGVATLLAKTARADTPTSPIPSEPGLTWADHCSSINGTVFLAIGNQNPDGVSVMVDAFPAVDITAHQGYTFQIPIEQTAVVTENHLGTIYHATLDLGCPLPNTTSTTSKPPTTTTTRPAATTTRPAGTTTTKPAATTTITQAVTTTTVGSISTTTSPAVSTSDPLGAPTTKGTGSALAVAGSKRGRPAALVGALILGGLLLFSAALFGVRRRVARRSGK